jgi:hypothetical protein
MLDLKHVSVSVNLTLVIGNTPRFLVATHAPETPPGFLSLISAAGSPNAMTMRNRSKPPSPSAPIAPPATSPTVEIDVEPVVRFCFSSEQDDCGPHSWPDLPIEGNQCGGDRNSPIAISGSDICEPVNYMFTVRKRSLIGSVLLTNALKSHRVCNPADDLAWKLYLQPAALQRQQSYHLYDLS